MTVVQATGRRCGDAACRVAVGDRSGGRHGCDAVNQPGRRTGERLF